MKRTTLWLAVGIAVAVLPGSFPNAQTPTSPPLLPVYYADGSSVPNVHVVVGKISVPEGSWDPKVPLTPKEFPVTLSSAAAFMSADSYKCFVSQPYGPGSGGIVRTIDGSHFVYRAATIGPACVTLAVRGSSYIFANLWLHFRLSRLPAGIPRLPCPIPRLP